MSQLTAEELTALKSRKTPASCTAGATTERCAGSAGQVRVRVSRLGKYAFPPERAFCAVPKPA